MPLLHPQATTEIFLLLKITVFHCWEGKALFQCPFLSPLIFYSTLRKGTVKMCTFIVTLHNIYP